MATSSLISRKPFSQRLGFTGKPCMVVPTPCRMQHMQCASHLRRASMPLATAQPESVQTYATRQQCNVPNGSHGAWRTVPELNSQRQYQSVTTRAAGMPGMPGAADQGALAQMMIAYAMQLQQQQEQANNINAPFGAEIRVKNLQFHPPGAEKPLLNDVSFTLPANRLGLVIGRSGSGKTTLLQMMSGLLEQNSGNISIVRPGSSGGFYSGVNGLSSHMPSAPSTVEQRMEQIGLVFQFPERHFLGTDILQELTFTWPREMAYLAERNTLSSRVQGVLEAVRLAHVPLNVSPLALSGGQQRRLALAIQLIRRPALLLLDEPLAGLDWQSRKEVVELLRQLKERCTVLVVSHDLAEIAPLVDCAWRMRLGGTCERVDWPPADLAGLEQ